MPQPANANSVDVPENPARPALPSTPFELGTLRFAALGDRVIVQEDEFRTGYECEQCNGSGRTACDDCGGTGRHGVKKCSICEGNGTLMCLKCGGKGGLLIAPEISQRRPTSGKIVSAGPKCETLRVGQSVLFSNFAGYVIDLDRAGKPVTLRILHETEVLCLLDGHLDLRGLRFKSEIAVAQP